ncbi:MAG: hypothetical protein IT249_21055 [Chitinophagaceae bacterium]|nr:hypothetical protein [Chitinophagaceae bacterium]
MDKNIPDIDHVFRTAHEAYEQEPSNEVWQKLEARLDKRDAEKYRKWFLGWRIAGVLLFIACGILALYKSSLFDTNQNTEGIASRNNQNSGRPVSQKDELTRIDKPEALVPETQVRQSSADTAEARTASTEIARGTEKSMIASGSEKTGVKKSEQALIRKRQPVLDKQKNDSAIQANQRQYNNSVKEKNAENNALTKIRPLIKPGIQTIEINQREVILNPYTSLKHIAVEKTYPKSNISSIKISRMSKPSWSVSAYASNNWSGYRIDDDDHHNRGNRDDHKDDIFERESHEGAFTLGINVARQFRKWNIISGLYYAQIKIGIAPQHIYASPQSNGNMAYKYVTSSGYYNINPDFNGAPVTGDSIQSEGATHSLRIISVPLMAGYKISSKRFSIIPALGIATNYIAGARIKTTLTNAGNTDKLSVNRLSGMHHFYFDFTAQAYLQYGITKKWAINLIPSMKYAITPVTKDNVVKTFPYNFGVGAGITYEF